MKRFAFITPGFTESTIPLIQQFLEHENYVDLYFLSRNVFTIYPAFNKKKQTNIKLVTEISKNVYSELHDYLGDNFNAYAIKLNRPYRTVPILKNICLMIRRIFLNKFSSYINAAKYDGIYILSLYDSEDSLQLCKKIKGNLIVGLHEVCKHSNPDFENVPKLIAFLSMRKIPIVVYSSKSKCDILKYKVVCDRHVYETRFGKFNTYPVFKGKSGLSPQKGYFLFMGNIKPYKGVDVFIASALELLKDSVDCEFIIAGSGYDASMDKVKNHNNFTIINRFINNEELADLIAGCLAVVCPYKSASQSGVIQSAYAFNKPVIVSDLDSFRECVIENKTGEFCKVNDIESLKIAMGKFYKNTEYLKSLVWQIEHIDDILLNYSWSKIYNDYKFFWQ